jgi:hypothetical protein
MREIDEEEYKNSFMKTTIFLKCLFLLYFLINIVFASEDCPEANTSAIEGLVIEAMMAGKAGISGKQLLAEAKKAMLKDCQESPYVYVFKKLNEKNDEVSEFLEVFDDTTLLKVDKITKDNATRELSEDELKLYPRNKIKKRINEYYLSQPDTIYYIDTVYYDTTWIEETTKKGHLDKWASGKPFFSTHSLDDFSKLQWRFEEKFEKEYDEYNDEYEYYRFTPDEVSFVSKQDLRLKLQGVGFRDQITTLLSYADKNKIGIFYYKSTEKIPYALVVAKRKYAKYISGKFFHE